VKYVNLLAVIVVCIACKSSDKAPAESKSSNVAPTAPAPAPTTPPPAPPSTGPAAAAEPAAAEPSVAAAAGGVAGPFASIDAYCKAVLARLPKDDCDDPSEAGSNVCGCEPAKADEVTGARSLEASGGGLRGASLIMVARAFADYVHCDLAIETSKGWFVAPKIGACREAPASHDNALSVTVKQLGAARTGDADVITMKWQETSTGSKPRMLELRCTIDAAGTPSCTLPR
jgi:hypothetical protein